MLRNFDEECEKYGWGFTLMALAIATYCAVMMSSSGNIINGVVGFIGGFFIAIFFFAIFLRIHVFIGNSFESERMRQEMMQDEYYRMEARKRLDKE